MGEVPFCWRLLKPSWRLWNSLRGLLRPGGWGHSFQGNIITCERAHQGTGDGHWWIDSSVVTDGLHRWWNNVKRWVWKSRFGAVVCHVCQMKALFSSLAVSRVLRVSRVLWEEMFRTFPDNFFMKKYKKNEELIIFNIVNTTGPPSVKFNYKHFYSVKW